MASAAEVGFDGTRGSSTLRDHFAKRMIPLRACRALGVYQSFGDDALGYFTERLDPARIRAALIDILHRAKRNKAFHNSAFLGLAIDGTSAGRSSTRACALCSLGPGTENCSLHHSPAIRKPIPHPYLPVFPWLRSFSKSKVPKSLPIGACA